MNTMVIQALPAAEEEGYYYYQIPALQDDFCQLPPSLWLDKIECVFSVDTRLRLSVSCCYPQIPSHEQIETSNISRSQNGHDQRRDP